MKFVVVLKSYGDLVIALSSALKTNSTNITFVIGSHLVALYNTLNTTIPYVVLDTGSDVPAIYDIKKRGPVNAFLSMIRIKRAITQTLKSSHDIYVIKYGIRERIMFYGLNISLIYSSKRNIYIDYHKAFNKLSSIDVFPREDILQKVCIFPDSRLFKKVISESTVNQICTELTRLNVEFNICLYGQPCSSNLINFKEFDQRIIHYHTFSDLCKLIKSASHLVSSDSLSAHIAEFYSRPVFVIFNEENIYWLPLNSFVHDLYETLGVSKCIEWITRAKKR